MTNRSAVAAALIGFVLAAFGSPARGEEVEKKFRLGFALGNYDTRTQIESDSANTLLIVDQNNELVDFIRDPRNDSAAIGTLGIKNLYTASLTGAYAFNRMFVLEASVGYRKGDVGDVEVQAQFAGQTIPQNQNFAFNIYRIKAGTMTQLPIDVTAMARFRPKAALSPYLGLGAGYVFMGYKPSPEFDRLSRNMDASVGGLGLLVSLFNVQQLLAASSTHDLTGAHVDSPDTFEWHLAGGMEYAFKKHWAAYVDARYVFASRQMTFTFDGQKDFGNSVPRTTVEQGTPVAVAPYGAIQIVSGGLVDGGRLVPLPANPGADCTVEFSKCEFVAQPDGQVDPGVYYAKGGSVKYGGLSLLVGIKYTF